MPSFRIFFFLKILIVLSNVNYNVASSISSTSTQTCAIEKYSKTVSCFGIRNDTIIPDDSIQFESISSADYFSCGITLIGKQILCWKRGYYVTSELSSITGFTKVSTGLNHACALKNQKILCMGRDDYGQATPPSGNFVDVSCGNKSTCAIDVNGKIHCFGKHFDSDRFGMGPPNGTFVEVHVGPGTQACAVSSIGEIHCWGAEEFEENQVHSGPFLHVNAHLYGYCGTHANLTVECFGRTKVFQDLALSTQFLQISIGTADACGVENGTNLLLCETVGLNYDLPFLPNDFEVYIGQ